MLDYIEGKFEFYSTTNLIIFSIVFVVNFFCILIFNEVIILNFCGMDYNTIKRIQAREKIDSDFDNMISLRNVTKEEDEED